MQDLARFGRPHLRRFALRCKARRTHRPKHTPALALPRCLRLLPEQHRHLTKGLASPTIDATAGARRGYRFDVAVLMSPSARERLPIRKTNWFLHSPSADEPDNHNRDRY